MTNYSKHFKKPALKQTVKDKPHQVKNSAGGYVYATDDWKRLDRFLIIGSDGGSYYASEKKLTLENASNAKKLLDASVESGKKVIDRAVEISDAGRAPKNDPALLAMALALCSSHEEVRQYAVSKLPDVARIATFLFTFIDYVGSKDSSGQPIMRGWGRSLRRAVANWYNSKTPEQLALQVCKYKSRSQEGSQSWSHKDLLRKAHVKPCSDNHSAIFKYVTKGWTDTQLAKFPSKKKGKNPFEYIYAHEMAQKATSAKEIVGLIDQYSLVRESIPTQFLNEKAVWDKLLEGMPLMAMVRNLSKMTVVGTLGPLGNGNRQVIETLNDGAAIKKARLHPLSILAALRTYQQGHGMKGGNSWTPVQAVVDALDSAFYLAFDQIEPTGKNIMFAVDCSGSMSSPAIGSMQYINCREIAAALAMVSAKKESNYLITGFTSGGGYGRSGAGIKELPISPRMRLDSVAQAMSFQDWGGTDCSLPMTYAKSRNLKVDAFVVITDNETYAGSIKPDEALRQYRSSSGIKDAKLVVVGVTATDFTIADPKDMNMFDVVGFDTASPQLIADFIRGDL